MELKTLTWGKGLNADILPSELSDGYCSGAVNARFRNGFAERAGGVLDGTTTYLAAIGTTPEWMDLFASSQSSTGRYLIYAGAANVYADNLAQTKVEITRYTEGAAISSITSVGTTATLTTATNHGRTTGDTVSIWGAVPAGYNVTAVITVTGVTTFTYTIVSVAGVAATSVGMYSYNGAASNFTGIAKDWTGGPLNGVFIINNATNGLYYWSGISTEKLRKFPDAYKCDSARPFGYFIMQLAPTIDAVKQKHTVSWSASTEPGSIPSTFIPSATNDAGDTDYFAATSGTLIDGCEYGDVFFVYKDDAVFGMRFVGGNAVFDVFKLPIDTGVMTKNCIANTPKGQVFLTANNDVLIHNGGQATSLAQGRVRSLLKAINPLYRNLSFVSVNPYANEVLIVYCSASATVPDTALIWNWDEDTWGSKTLAGMKSACSGLITEALGAKYMVLGAQISGANKIGIVELSEFNFVAGFEATVERQGITFGDQDTMKILQRSRWNFDAAAGTLSSIYHGSSMAADGTVTYSASAPFSYMTGTTNFAAQRATAGRFLAVKTTLGYSVVSTVITLMKLRSCQLEYANGGRR